MDVEQLRAWRNETYDPLSREESLKDEDVAEVLESYDCVMAFMASGGCMNEQRCIVVDEEIQFQVKISVRDGKLSLQRVTW